MGLMKYRSEMDSVPVFDLLYFQALAVKESRVREATRQR